MQEQNASTPKKGKKQGVGPALGSPKHFRWTNDMESMLLDLLIREDEIGNRVGGTFTSSAYRNVIKEVNSIFGTAIQKNHIVNNLKTLKHHFGEFRDALHGMSGFSWNWETKKFEAEEYVWDALIKEKQEAANLKDKPLHHWDKMNRLFAVGRATGDKAVSLKERNKRFQERLDSNSRGIDIASIDRPMRSVNFDNCTEDCNFNGVAFEQSTPYTTTSAKTGGSSRKSLKRKASLAFVLEAGYETIAAGMKEVSRAIVESGAQMANRKFLYERNGKIFAELQSLQLSMEYVLQCYEYLTNNDTAVGQFLGIPKDYRMQMLTKIMTTAGIFP